MVDKATLLKTLLDLLLFGAMICVYVFIIVVAVLAVDGVALWMLNLLTDLNTWLNLLFWESFILMLFGVGALWRRGEHIFVARGWKRPRIYHVSLRSRYPWFWFLVTMAGFVLFILFAYLAVTFYGI